jgi:hypothetical protein
MRARSSGLQQNSDVEPVEVTRGTMNPPRKSLFSVMLVAALLGTPALASAGASSTHGGVDHPPAMQLATLPLRTRTRRRARGAIERTIAWLSRRGARRAAPRIRAGRERVHPRLAPHDWNARGPPRSSGR